MILSVIDSFLFDHVYVALTQYFFIDITKEFQFPV